MNFLGTPISIQNTDGRNWLVTWKDVVTTDAGESVSFTVAIRRDGNMTITDMQQHAVRTAIELLQATLPETAAAN